MVGPERILISQMEVYWLKVTGIQQDTHYVQHTSREPNIYKHLRQVHDGKCYLASCYLAHVST